MLRMWRPAVLVAICLAVLVGSPAVAAERIRIGWQPSLTYGMYVMMDEGFAEKEGLTIEYLKFTSGPAMLAALASGDIDMASFTVVPGVYAIAQGIDIKFILMTEDFQTGEALVARRPSGIRTMRDQKGKRIAVTKGSIAHWGLLRSLKASNLTEKDLTVLDMAPGVMVPAFIKGDIDGAWVWEPWVVKLEQEGGVTAGSFKELGMPALNTIAVRSAFLADNGATVQKFLRVWDRALSVPVNEKTVATISSTLGMTPQMTRTALAKLKPFTMEEQLRGRLGSMGTTETKAESSLLSHLKEFVSFLVEEKKLKSSIADNALLRSVEPGPVQEYLKLKR